MLYINPDTMMPLASAFAAVAGVIMMFWQKLRVFFRAILGKSGRPPEKGA